MSDAQIVFAILFGAIILFVTELVPIAVTAMLVLISLVLTGVLDVATAFSGFSNSTVILFGAMFVIGESVFKTGLAETIGTALLRKVGTNPRRLVLAVVILAAAMSAFLSNTGTVAVLLPIVAGLGRFPGVSKRSLLLPMAFATSLGGMLTMVGTPPNLIVNGVLEDRGIVPFGFLDFGRVALIGSIIGIAYMVLFSQTLLGENSETNAKGRNLGNTNLPRGSAPVDLKMFGTGDTSSNVSKMWLSGLTLIAVSVVMIGGWLPLHLVAVMGACFVVLTRCLTIEEAFAGIDWTTIFLFAGMLPLGTAMETSGAAGLMANKVLEQISGASLTAVIAAVFMLTCALTQFMSNTATAALVAPIGISIAETMEISAYPIMMTIALAGSTAFITPIATPPNTMVLGSGEYRFLDYVKFGTPLTAICFIVTVLLVPVFFPA